MSDFRAALNVAFTQEEQDLLKAFADQAAIAVSNARLYQSVLHEKQQLDALIEQSADGVMILVAANQDSVFERLAACMEEPEMARDPRYATHRARGEHQAELDARIARWTR